MDRASSSAFKMDRELASGSFERQRSQFRGWVGNDPRQVAGAASHGLRKFPVAAGRYHLYVSLACPWCHRTVIVRELAGLADALPISYLAPFRDARGWAFTGERFDDGPGGEYVDNLHGWQLISEAYRLSDPEFDFDERITVPVLWDTQTEHIVSNESADILRMLADPQSLGSLAKRPLDLYPERLRAEIDTLNARVYDTVNNGVYRAGFARRQESYEQAFGELFETLEMLERLLGERRYLLGAQLTEADWRLFPTLMRFDEVYNLHFRCNKRRLVDYPNLWRYARELYQHPGVAQTVAMAQIKRHYYTTHEELNPKQIIPVGPGFDWTEPHGRDRRAAA
ncbi:MAG TPA: glutathione S-transferase C-terminal domain-containing protein [Solirubrobacteraceae bacterium]|nr:glutathione S-transferase C-terminal domain-containing protein [Solirubrobacteraceae bacterium]